MAIQQMRGLALYNLQRLPQAIRVFEATALGGSLPRQERDKLTEQIAQLKIATENPAQGAALLEDWAARGGVLTLAVRQKSFRLMGLCSKYF